MCVAALGLAAGAPPDSLDPLRTQLLAGINDVRPGGKPLVLSPILCRTAQARAEELSRSGRNPHDAKLAEAATAAERAGYDALLLSEIFIEAEGDVPMFLATFLHGEGALAREVARAPLRDLGIGFVLRGDLPPLYVFLFGLSWPDYLTAKRKELGDLSRVRRELLERVNRERARIHLAPLSPNPKLDAAAQAHAEDMLARSYFGHNSPEGNTVLERSKLAGYRPHYSGENLAEGQDSFDQVVAGWMASPVHREHILSQVFSDLGSGLAIGENKRGHQILWVQVFGRSK
ncbi:MAG TPA: CAP domain-containing protein [Thermoanaerobaculia bacterium]